MTRGRPIDQAHGLRRLFAHSEVRFIPVVSNPHVAFDGLMLERLCSAFTQCGVSTLVVDASERAGAPAEMALLDLSECIEPLSSHVAYLSARGLPLKFVDATGSTHGFLDVVARASPASQVVLVHAEATDLCRLFSRISQDADAAPVCPLLLADDHPVSVTHAYAAMKLLTGRAGVMVYELVLGAAERSPRAERIAIQLALCADDFLGAALRDWIRIDPSTDATEASGPALRRWARERLREGNAPRAAANAHAQGLNLPPPPRAGGAMSNRAVH